MSINIKISVEACFTESAVSDVDGVKSGGAGGDVDGAWAGAEDGTVKSVEGVDCGAFVAEVGVEG